MSLVQRRTVRVVQMFYMELVSRAIEFLHVRGSASSAELASHVFGGEAFVPLLASLHDVRLTFDGDAWRLLPPVAELAILEVLATGPDPRRHRIVEVAAQRGAARFHALIFSDRPVPKLLRKVGVPEAPSASHPPVLRGRRVEDLDEDAPAAATDEWLALERAASELRAFLAGATVAGFGFVPEFLELLLGTRWPAIDLLRLVWIEGFRGRPDPVHLAKHFGLTPPLGRRPAAMLGFSLALLEHLRASRSVAELCLLGEPRRASAPAYQALAEEPGVYVMASAEGEPLYVGKSVNLKRRVGSYLRSPIAISRNLQDLMELTERIDVVPVDSDLEAVLLEKQLIDEWLPPFNLQRRWGERRLYLRLSTNEAFPRLSHAAQPEADGAIYFGPMRHATAAVRLRSLLTSILRLRTCRRQLPSAHKPRPPCGKAGAGECLAPCIIGPPAEPYGAEVKLAKELLSATPDEFRELLRSLVRKRPPRGGQARRLKRQIEMLSDSGKAAPNLSLWD